MLKPEKFDTTPVGWTAVKPGAHTCIIKEVRETTSRNGNQMLAVYFDFDENDTQMSYFTEIYKQHKKQFGDDAKWRGCYYITLCGEYATANIKRFTTAVERSNKGFVTQWDLVPGDGTFCNCFKGKRVGMVFRTEEYRKQDGSIGKSTKPFRVCEYGKVKETKVPDVKKLPAEPTPVISNDPVMAAEGFYEVPEGFESEMPFN